MRIECGDTVLVNGFEGEVYGLTIGKYTSYRISLYDRNLKECVDFGLKKIKPNTYRVTSGLFDDPALNAGLSYEKYLTSSKIKVIFRPGHPKNKISKKEKDIREDFYKYIAKRDNKDPEKVKEYVENFLDPKMWKQLEVWKDSAKKYGR